MPEIDRHLRGGLDEGALHEVKPERRQAGAVVSDWATALGFVLRLTVRRLHGLGSLRPAHRRKFSGAGIGSCSRAWQALRAGTFLYGP
ncbi:MAG: hypothetical protein GY877_06525 [Hyphomicrobium sp.]|nr:hypothetical protein [Hyphomicrobium sp.]